MAALCTATLCTAALATEGRGAALLRRLLLALLLAQTAGALAEPEMAFSGFATLGGAISDQDFRYQRFIDNGGTLKRDSLIGAQLDLRLTDAWGLTVQGKIAPAVDADTGWKPTLTWAFLSWRPTNDWLVRLGRLRLPLMLYSANSDVGMTFDFARLPTELYALMPATDVLGIAVSKTWLAGANEWTLEGYLGETQTHWRYWVRDAISPAFPGGSSFLRYDMQFTGLALTLRRGESTWRLGAHLGTAEGENGPVPRTFRYVSLAPGIGYYDVSVATGTDFPQVDAYEIYLLTLGADIALPHDFRLIGEVCRRRFTNATTGASADGGYLALTRRMGHWTPYAYVSALRTTDAALDFISAVNANRVPDFIPAAGLINASQRLGADLLSPFDQQSLAVGAAYQLSPTSKLKVEWLHSRTGSFSTFVDTPTGEESGGRQLNVFSLTYDLVF